LETLSSQGNDTLWKVNDFLDAFEGNCREFYVCGIDLVLDEMMLRFSGRSAFDFRTTAKTHAYWIENDGCS
jgi:hypothetical protein